MIIWHLIKHYHASHDAHSMNVNFHDRIHMISYDEMCVTPEPLILLSTSRISDRFVMSGSGHTSSHLCVKTNQCNIRRSSQLLITFIMFFIDFCVSNCMLFWKHLFDNIQSVITTRNIYLSLKCCFTVWFVQSQHTLSPFFVL